ncbi:MAG: PAAR domain-containing protein [Acidobacteria bacterium]|nr:PAAR domain-containing protein [Acidobacteriota bacterium]
MPPACRLTDFHQCPLSTPVGPVMVPHVGGPVAGPGAPTVLIGGLPAAKVGDIALCVGPPDAIVKGSRTVKVQGLPAARLGDKTAHGGTLVVGLPTVMIGG